MRPFFTLASLLGVSALASSIVNPHWFRDGQRWVRAAWSNESARVSPAEVEKQIVTQIGAIRHARNVPQIETDDMLKIWLGQRMDAGELGEMDELVHEAQQLQPRYQMIRAFTVRGPSIEGLLEQVELWPEQADAELTHEAVVARPRSAKMGYECVVLAGTRLPDFMPETLGRGGDRYYSKCSLCGHGQACKIVPQTRSISLECPLCHRVYAMLSVDTHHRFHYVTEYLKGYQPPAHFPDGLSRYAEMRLIWRSVTSSIRYLPDSTPTDPEADIWQFPDETMRLGTGDCEDSAILLANWLIARGFEARVAIGRYGEVGGHAWVVVHLDGKSYLLESTNPEVKTTVPPLAQDVGSRYVAEIMFDPQAIYMRQDPSLPWDGDYWSARKWVRAPQKMSPAMLASEARPVMSAAARAK